MQTTDTAEPRTRKPRAAAATPAQPKSKKDRLVELLRAKTGADVRQLGEALGWLPHTVRAALTGLRKAGIVVDKMPAREGEPTRYRITAKRGRAGQ